MTGFCTRDVTHYLSSDNVLPINIFAIRKFIKYLSIDMTMKLKEEDKKMKKKKKMIMVIIIIR